MTPESKDDARRDERARAWEEGERANLRGGARERGECERRGWCAATNVLVFRSLRDGTVDARVEADVTRPAFGGGRLIRLSAGH